MADTIHSNIMHLTDDSFLETIKKETRPVFIDFYADWCGPCVAAAPIIDKLAKEYQAEMLITKINVDENPKTAQQYGVMSIPTVLVFKNDGGEAKVVGKQIGFAGEMGYRHLIDDVLEG